MNYPRAWWRDSDLSGSVVTSRGPIAQFYDQSEPGTGGRGALVGFLDNEASTMTKEERQEAVLGQLVRVFGDIAARDAEYEDAVWGEEQRTSVAGERVVVHSNVGHSVYQARRCIKERVK